MKRATVLFDRKVAAMIGQWPVSWRKPFIFITGLGDPILIVAIASVIVVIGWSQQNLPLVATAAMVWCTLLMGAALKRLFGRMRPVTEYAANLRIKTLSFPSGHSSGSMIMYGILAYLGWHLLAQPWGWIGVALGGILVFSIGVSRVYLGAHFPSDVLAGWLLGLGALAIVILGIGSPA